MHQDLLARLQRTKLEDVQPGSGVHLRQCSGFMQAKAFGHRQYVAGVDHHFLGHGTAGQQRADPITHAPGCASAHFFDHPEHSSPMYGLAPGGGGYKPFICSKSARFNPAAATRMRTARVTGRAFGLDPGHMSVNALQCLHSASIVESYDRAWDRCAQAFAVCARLFWNRRTEKTAYYA